MYSRDKYCDIVQSLNVLCTKGFVAFQFYPAHKLICVIFIN